ncbi:MAG: nitroreductase family protein [Bacteroidota bacterium]|nr:nitroreductase family protein [Bacteroidota bacterium]
MDFLELAQKRFSVRTYEDRKIEKEKLLYILEAGRLAPSAVNYQPWEFIVLTKPESLEKIHQTYPREWFKLAPAVILVCGDHNQGWRRPSDNKDHTDIDIAIAVDHMVMATTELELGTCWVCNFNASLCKELFELPHNLEPIVLLPIGYPKVASIPEKKRKHLQDIVHWEKL